MKALLIRLTAVMFIVFLITSCSKDNPLALARETFDLGKQALEEITNPGKAAEIAKKVAAIQLKVARMSRQDRQRYNDELARLSANALGDLINISTDGLLDNASSLFNEASMEETMKALEEAAQQAINAFNSSGGN